MATGSFSHEGFRPVSATNERSLLEAATRDTVKFLSSLQLTVVLFALAILIVLFGTLAQTEYNIDYVMAKYFRTFVAAIEFKVLMPVAFFPNLPASLREGIPLGLGNRVVTGFYFPGGWLIGAVMVLNLICAHYAKFKIQASGGRLFYGLVVTAVGVLITTAVILIGSIQSGETNDFFKAVPYLRILWQLALGTMAGIVLMAGCWLLFKKRAGIVVLHLGVGMIMLNELLVGTLAVEGQMPIDEGQTGFWIHNVSQSELAIVDTTGDDEDVEVIIPAAMLKAGTRIEDDNLPFDLEVIEYHVNGMPRDVKDNDELIATAGRGRQWVGEEAIKSVGTKSEVDRPLAYVTFFEKGTDNVLDTHLLVSQGLLDVVVPTSEIPEKVMSEEVFAIASDPALVSSLDAGIIPAALATAFTEHEVKISKFARVESQTASRKWRLTNPNATYVLVEKDAQLHVYRTHDVYLRFARRYTDYSVHLIDVRKDDYVGTSTPRNYSSDVRFVDTAAKVDFEPHIWMNNPLRYDGETFYQSGYYQHPVRQVEVTTLQIVSNTGWMIPYIACMIVVVGMLGQFGLTLDRFAKRQTQSAEPSGSTGSKGDQQAPVAQPSSLGTLWICIGVVIAIVFGLYVLSKSRKPKPETFDYYAFGEIPIMYEGRAKPMDTLARTSLRLISDRQTFDWSMDEKAIDQNWQKIKDKLQNKWPKLESKELNSRKYDRDALTEYIVEATDAHPYNASEYVYKLTIEPKQPATRWLLDVTTQPHVGYAHRVIRIENLELLDTLGLERRKGFRYALSEFGTKIDLISQQADEARKLDATEMSLYQKKLLELEKKIGILDLLTQTFTEPPLRRESIQQDLMMAIRRQEMLKRRQPPLVVPLTEKEAGKEGEWETYQTAWTRNLLARAAQQEPNEAVELMGEILTDYATGETSDFNSAVAKYNRRIEEDKQAEINFGKLHFETFFNNWSPFYYCMVPYLAAFVIAMAGLMGNGKLSHFLNWTAFTIICVTLIIHTFALGGRIYISGRPPVTNLYSSAVFIGWGCVILALLLEVIFRNGVGNIGAAVTGFAGLLIAFLLTTAVPSFKGDTFTVLQAVLDTQFWLATHVVCITLGYSTTFLAGILGIVYVLRQIFLAVFYRLGFTEFEVANSQMTSQKDKDIIRMIYGIVCFSIFFSFFGTVLGGLWADDSWGRFWGWDPKENGALIIVLWNAIVLHARWGGMVKNRGMAVLAIGGNIVTAWSWFGVNELGVGLHSYGFTEGVLKALFAFWVSQFMLIVVGLLPWDTFRGASGGDDGGTPATA